MLKTVKRILMGSLSILGISVLVWTIALLNPSLSYAHHTKIENVTVYHNQDLPTHTEEIVKAALKIISKSEIYEPSLEIDFCLNDGSKYNEFHPLAAGLAYSFLDKAILYKSKPNFKENIASTNWEINNFETRHFDLTYLLAHEFMHCVQSNENVWLQFDIGNWKLEGHAEYISRIWKNDNLLMEKIEIFLKEEKSTHAGLPVIELTDGTKQIFSYYKYGLLTQYLMEQEELNFSEFMNDDRSIDKIYAEMLAWKSKGE